MDSKALPKAEGGGRRWIKGALARKRDWCRSQVE